MKYKTLIRIISFIELFIGLATIVGLIASSLVFTSAKPVNIFVFVLISSLISVTIGLGLFHYREWARKVLLFFSTYIVLTKILIFFSLISFNGEIITFISTESKNFISITYHVLLIAVLIQPAAKKNFLKK